MKKVVIIGGGASGMMAAAVCGSGCDVTLLEQNEKLGKKIYITGKGRCNLTNDSDVEKHLSMVKRNPKFLYSAFYSFDPYATMSFFEEHGLKLKTEHGNRVFPVSDHASDVIKTLERAMEEAGVTVRLNEKVTHIETNQGGVCGVKTNRSYYEADAVIIATGGISYPSCGSDGSGYELVKKLGHTVKTCTPSLVGLHTKEEWVKELMGLSLRNVKVSYYKGTKCLFEEQGEMLFTHTGISGPVVLTASSVLNDEIVKGPIEVRIDLKPALSREQLDKRILRDFEENINRQFGNSLNKLLPAKMIPVVLKRIQIASTKKVNEITKEERMQILNLLKGFSLTVTGLGDFSQAVITKGGIPIKEVDPSTMESKLVKRLYLCGEMLDLDALTGGFNLQIAWSTGHLAGDSVLYMEQ
ncbi:MAG: NAD(P)/FAD-dependent oxidoreductase [Eubacterium sp.]|nr:NAD(P)/FAD-dependent oxidoreductase [Eubacterium sp.]